MQLRRLTRAETLQVIKTFNRAAGDRRMKQGDYKGEKAALMDEAAYEAGTDEDKDRMLHEAVAEFLEANMMRTRKRSADKAGMIDGGLVNRNIKATTRLFLSYLPAPLRTKWEAIMHAVRGVVGMSAMRGVIMKKAIRDGTLKEADIDAFLDKLTGRDLQAGHDGMVRDEVAAMVGQEEFEADENNPFSLDPSGFNGDDGTPLEQADKFLRTLSGKALVTADGLTASLSNNTAAKMTSWKAVQKSTSIEAHLAAIAGFEELFSNGVIEESSPDRNNDPNINAILRIVARFRFKGEYMAAKFTVKELVHPNQNRIYSIEALATENAPEGKWAASSSGDPGLTSAPRSGAQEPYLTKPGESQVPDSSPLTLGRATAHTTAETRVFQGVEGGMSAIGPAAFLINAYHGTPHKVDKFSTDKIGTGEGHQAYGWGLYFAAAREVAEGYQKALSGGEYIPIESLRKFFTPGNIVPSYGGADRVVSFNEGEQGDWSVTVQAVDEKGDAKYGERPRTHFTRPDVKAVKAAGLPTAIDGNAYTVTLDVNDEDLLDWDKPLRKQSEKVKKALSAFAADFTGAEIYKDVATKNLHAFGAGSDHNKAAAKFMRQMGIPGISYLDGNSRADGEGSYNYVIFDESKIKITEENGKAVELKESNPFSLVPSNPEAPYGVAKEGSKVEKFNHSAASDFQKTETATTTGREIFGADGIPKESSLKAIIEKVTEWGLENGLFGDHPTPSLGGPVRVSANSVKNDLSHWAGPEKIESLAVLSDMLAKAVLIQTEISGKGGVRSHILAAKLNIRGESKVVSIVVRENEGKLFYDHEFVEKKEGGPTASQPVGDNTRGRLAEESPSAVKIVQNAISVKSPDSSPLSLAPSSYVDSMALNIAARIKDPKAKMSMFTRMLEKLVDLKRDRDEIGVAFG